MFETKKKQSLTIREKKKKIAPKGPSGLPEKLSPSGTGCPCRAADGPAADGPATADGPAADSPAAADGPAAADDPAAADGPAADGPGVASGWGKGAISTMTSSITFRARV